MHLSRFFIFNTCDLQAGLKRRNFLNQDSMDYNYTVHSYHTDFIIR